MTISNVKQKVNESRYKSEFERIFGKKSTGNSGSYRYDKKTGELVKTGKARILKSKMHKMVEKIRGIGPITINRSANANRASNSIGKQKRK
jgi:hypothetical protein